MTGSINISEMLFSLQDKMTTGGAISSEQRSFYTTFRRKLEEAPGNGSRAHILELLNQTRSQLEGKFSDAEFNEFVTAVLSKVERVEHVEEIDVDAELESIDGLEATPVQEISPMQNHHPSDGILSRFQSLGVGALAILGAATLLSLGLFYFTQ